MNPRATGILLIIAAALGAFVYLYELEGAGGRLEAVAEGERVFRVEADAITSLLLRTTDGQAVRLERNDGAWNLVEPVAFPADAFSTDAIASALVTLRSDGAFENAGPPEEYGLDAGRARSVRFEIEDELFEMRLGNDSPVGSKRYIWASGDIHAVARHMVNAFDKTLDDLRNKDIVDFDRRRVRRVEATWPGGRVVIEGEAAPDGEEDVVWRITAPVEAAADQEVVADLLSEMDFLRADGFVDEAPAVTGFDPAAFRVRLSGPADEEGGEPFEVDFAIGAALDDGMRLARGAGSALYTVPASRLDAFVREVVDYRDKELARFSLGDAQRVDLYFQQPGGDPVSIVLERQGFDWSSAPEAMDPDKILPMVSELSRLSASAILAESVGADELVALELSPPNTLITVLGKVPEGDEGGPAPKLAEVRIGRAQGAGGVVVQRPGDPVLYRLPVDAGEQVPLTLEAFRNRFLVPVEPDEIPGAAEEDDLLPTL